MADKGRVVAIADDHRIISPEFRSAPIGFGVAGEVALAPGASAARLPEGAVAVLGLCPSDALRLGDTNEVLPQVRRPVVVYTFADDRNLIHETPLDRLEAKISCPDKSFIDSLMRVEVAATAAHFSGAKPLVVVRRRGREPQLVGREVIPTQQSPEATRVTVEDLGDDAM